MSWLDAFTEIRSKDWSKVPDPEREEKAKEVVNMTAYASAAAAMVPIPFVDLALLLPFHSAMVMTVGHVLGRPINDAEAKRVALELGAVAGVTLAARAGLTALKKLVLPGVGGVLAAPASFAATWALGRVTIRYFQDPELSREELRTVFKDAFKEAGSHFSAETFDRFRKQRGTEAEGAAPTADNPEQSAESVGEAAAPTSGAPTSGASASGASASGASASGASASGAPTSRAPASRAPTPPPSAPRAGAPLSAVPDDEPTPPADRDSIHRKKRSL